MAWLDDSYDKSYNMSESRGPKEGRVCVSVCLALSRSVAVREAILWDPILLAKYLDLCKQGTYSFYNILLRSTSVVDSFVVQAPRTNGSL